MNNPNQIQTYKELIEWNLGRIIEPPYDKDLSDADEKWNSCIRSTISYLKGRIEELKKDDKKNIAVDI